MIALVWLLAVVVVVVVLAYLRAGGAAWLAATAALLVVAWILPAMPLGVPVFTTLAYILVATALAVPRLRRSLVSEPLLDLFRGVLPPMTATEREALEAGTVWWDGELFSGDPDWAKLLRLPPPALTEEERSFLDNEVSQLCEMVSEWDSTHVWRDLPPEAWQFIKDKGFFGMIIPKRYGGLGFSAYAHSQVVQKVSTRSGTLAVTVLVPNSLGPGELLLHYGTEEQKNHYLPRLARGLEIPCFALTNPHAGSDAASIPDRGVVCRGVHAGHETLGFRITWDKRYITLAPVATLLGLAFRAHDPEHLLGGLEDLGITCALVPTSHPGVRIGRRHMPLNCVFQNGPTWGDDVFVPLDWVIGGREQVGRGWRMLMECLAAGRGISLPSSNTGMSKLVVRTTGAYARIRRQFRLPIGRFEGVEEPLARMGGNLYAMDSARRLTAVAVDLGEKPAVLSAIAKLHITERNRQVINDAMDIAGGKGICMGPSNFLGTAYMQMPVSITVEGANILTRSLIVFGQGAIRCHPWVLREMAAAHEPDRRRAVDAFDEALFGHARFALGNAARAMVMGFTGSHVVRVPPVAPEMRRYFQQLTRFSAVLAFLADVSMGTLGGALKRKEKLSARLGDALSMLYLCSATLARYEWDGRPAEDAPLAHWAIWDAMFKAQNAIEGVISNFPNRLVSALVRAIVFPLGRPYVVPSDRLGHEVARRLIEPSPTRERLTEGMFVSARDDDPVRTVERALQAVLAAEPVEATIRDAAKSARLAVPVGGDELEAAVAAGIVAGDDAERVRHARRLTEAVIRVDDFEPDLGASLYRGRPELATARASGARAAQPALAMAAGGTGEGGFSA